MGFFGIDNAKKQEEQRKAHVPKGVPIALLHRQQCEACTLNVAHNAKSPKMRPMGAKKPTIYILTEAPSDDGDQRDEPLGGIEYDVIRSAIPRMVWDDLRFGTVIRTWPGAGKDVETSFGAIIETTKTPTPHQIECCRPSVIRDIERSKPTAIFSFGGTALRWAANTTHPGKWTGRRIPVQIGDHRCWLYPFMNPIDLVLMRRWEEHVHEYETTFRLHIANACEEVYENPGRPVIDDPEYIRRNVEIITGHNGAGDLKILERHLRDCVDRRTNGVDYETNALRPYNKTAKILTASVAHVKRSLAFPLYHRGAGWTGKERGMAWDMWGEYLYTKGPVKVAHQLPFEMEWSAFHWGEEVLRASKWGDSLSQAYVLNETQGLLGLEDLTTQYFGFNIKELSPVDRKRLDEFPVAEVLKYNALDSKYHNELFLEQEPRLRDEGLDRVYAHQVRRIPTLVLTSMHGVPVHQPTVIGFRDDHEAKLKVVEDEIRRDEYVIKFGRKYGHEFNEASGKDISKFLNDIGYGDVDGATEAALSKIKHPLIPLILRRRKLMKVLGTYIQSVCEEYTDRNGEKVPRAEFLFDDDMLHPIISTTKVATSRTSSEAPNIQNWPKRNENVIVRRQVQAKAGYKIYAFDYAGIQARNVAMESKDRRLVQAFIDRYDIHTDFMERMVDIYPKFIKEGMAAWDRPDERKKLAKHYRHIAKNKFVFPTFFGAQAKRVSTDCDVPLEAGEEMQAEFFNMFPEIKAWQLDIQAFYKRHGYVTGLSGYRRRAPVSWNELINSPIQADEALIVMEAMCELSELDYRKYQAMMEIHDDLTFMFPDNEADARIDTVIREMVKPRHDWINVPLVVELSVGTNWSDLKPVGNFENKGRNGDYVEFH